MDIAVVGSNMIDLVTYIDRMPKEGETLEAPQFQMGHGGKGANQAIAAARLGAEVRMVTRVGDDMFGPQTVENFRANGIDTEWVLPTEGSSGVAPIFVDPSSANSILIIKGANDRLSPADVEAASEAILAARLLVLQLEVPLETVYAAIDLASSAGVPVLLNPAPADPKLDPDWVGRCTYFVPNESELSILVGRELETVEEITEAARELMAGSDLAHLIVTLGSRGSLWVSSDGVRRFEATAVDAVDSTGAGDAFIGCFAAQVSRGADVAASIERAGAYAADSVTKRGTQTSFATAEEFDSWLKDR